MNWLTNLLTGNISSIINEVGCIVDQFHLSTEEKEKLKLESQSLLMTYKTIMEKVLTDELNARERVLVAELKQEDKYTKRARPTVVYAGLILIGINYCLVPIISKIIGADIIPIELPSEFWLGWSGIVTSWSIGRTFEKRGSSNKFSKFITGGDDKPSRLLS